MRSIRRLFVAVLLALSAAGAFADAPDGGPVDEITAQIVCDCGCNNLTVKNCTCGKADQVRADVGTRLRSGQSPAQILQAYVDEYGEQILAAPTTEGFNLVGWLAPFAAVLAGAVLLLVVLRRWSRVPWREAPLVQPLPASGIKAPDPSYLKRVQAEMEQSER
ncbi:MAG TPA: cytochrome c-type biogenesis protein CcmH [Candidatus Polarisedimenticolia bacterium]|nr:cytochrome c-type biogenesis protein CcmH [Candidatus Polarisedimenticolia bacterium]